MRRVALAPLEAEVPVEVDALALLEDCAQHRRTGAAVLAPETVLRVRILIAKRILRFISLIS